MTAGRRQLLLVLCLAALGCSGAWRASSAQQVFLEQLQHDTFDFFWEKTNPENGLTPDRVPGPQVASVGAVGFALTSYLVGAERGYVTRAEAARRTLATVRFLWQAPQGDGPTGVAGYRGFFYHFLDMTTGLRARHSELSTIDTALLMAGVLAAASYFDRADAVEGEIRAVADQLYRRVEWRWAASGPREPLLSMGWRPEEGLLASCWEGYNEGMLLYVLALGSPTHPIDPSSWQRWTATYRWDEASATPHVQFGPLFGHQYSHVWVDFRGIQDDYMRSRGIDYFVNSRRATHANRAYCIDNPRQWQGYSGEVWGLTASDGPPDPQLVRAGLVGDSYGYCARGIAAHESTDDGTLAPTAVGGSVPFAPEVTIPTLEVLRDRYGAHLYGRYGFKDAFNLSHRAEGASAPGWFAQSYLGIDQGPILLMIENYRTEFVWTLMKKNAYLQRGLERAGFTGGWLGAREGFTSSQVVVVDVGARSPRRLSGAATR